MSVHETTEDGESLLSLACSAGYYELAQVMIILLSYMAKTVIVLLIVYHCTSNCQRPLLYVQFNLVVQATVSLPR